MDLITAVTVLQQQLEQLNALVIQFQQLGYQTKNVLDVVNSVPEINPQIKSLAASMNIMITALNSQDVIVQATVDRISELST